MNLLSVKSVKEEPIRKEPATVANIAEKEKDSLYHCSSWTCRCPISYCAIAPVGFDNIILWISILMLLREWNENNHCVAHLKWILPYLLINSLEVISLNLAKSTEISLHDVHITLESIIIRDGSSLCSHTKSHLCMAEKIMLSLWQPYKTPITRLRPIKHMCFSTTNAT